MVPETRDKRGGTDASTWRRVDSALASALEQPSERRETWVREQFSSNPVLRDAVLALLREEAASAAMFDAVLAEREAIAQDALTEDTSALSLAGERLGAYRLEALIGSGGMGVVYRAERDDGEYDQTVAIKILPAWATDPDTVRRLRAERQILSSFKHPNITRLLDGGQTGDGFPYLVTEFIDGQELIEYVRQNALGLEARLDLFLLVADAVQYAHEQGVVHRDLKPANILVDAQGQPHLLDFGIAKLTEQSGIALTRARTATGFTPMTPDYASPEQLAGDKVGRGSDIYQLGLLLYELLTGQRPGQDGLVAAAVMTRPSTALRGRTETEPERSRELRQRAQRLRGDLDTVVLKALRPEPQSRYRSARSLARDIRHFRAGEAIEARPEPLWSAGKRLARHYPGASALAGTLLLLLVAWAVSVSFYSAELEQQRDGAERQALRAEQTRDVLIDVFRRSDPLQADAVGGAGASVWDSLAAAATEARQTLADDPEVLAELLSVLATLEYYAGNNDRYVALVEESVALYDSLGPAWRGAFLEQAVLLAGLLEGADPERSAALRAEADASLPVTTFADPSSEANVRIRMGNMDYGAGDYERALDHFDRALAVLDLSGSENWSPRIEAHFGRGNSLIQLGRLEEAERSLRTALTLTETHFGENHGRMTGTLSALSSLERLRDNADASIYWGERLVELMARDNVPDQDGLLAARNNLALAYHRDGRLDRARDELKRVIEARRTREGPEGSRSLAGNLKNLASVLLGTGELEAARATVLEALTMMERTYPAGSPVIATAWFTLGQVELDRGAVAEAETAFEETLALLEPALGNGHVQVHITRCHLAEVYRRRGQRDSALTLAGPAMSGIEAAQTRYPDHQKRCEDTLRALDRQGRLQNGRGNEGRSASS